MAYFDEFRVEGEAKEHFVAFFSKLNYRFDDGSTLKIEQEAAWCEGCQKFVCVECVPSAEVLAERIQALLDPSDMTSFLYPTPDAIEKALDELWVRLTWRLTRESPARCLRCGSTDIEAVRFGN